MSDQHHLRSPTPVGIVDHVSTLSENLAELVENEDYSDITLIVEKTRFPGHKIILASRSEYFRALLFGGMKESLPGVTEIVLQDTPPVAFSSLLKYMYTGRMNLLDFKEENLLDILGLAHRFGFVELESSISDYLKAILNIKNVCVIYDLANMYNLTSLCNVCKEFIERNASEILRCDYFYSLSQSSARQLLSRDSFCAQEIDIFCAVREWAEHNPGQDPTPILDMVRLPLMSMNELLNIVRPTGLVSPDIILDAINTQLQCRNNKLQYRGFLMMDENVATSRHGSQVLRGEMKSSLLDGDRRTYDLDRGFSRHPIDDNNGQGIVVKLGQAFMINAINMLLWDRDMRSYSYYIEVSMDDKDYERIIDHTEQLCRSWQRLRFPERVVRFIRIVGTHNTVNRVFHVVGVECMYMSTPCTLEQGLLVPTENVATIKKNACVIEGVSRSRDALINGETRHYDWDSGYTCHQLGSGAIVVQLAQPYIIDSIRLLLWDCDDRSYSYYVEVSTDQHKWQMVADKKNEACKSWQTIRFERRPVALIRIVGTHNTANEVFHCVHFECPADTSSGSGSSSVHGPSVGVSNISLVAGPPVSPSVSVSNRSLNQPPNHPQHPGRGGNQRISPRSQSPDPESQDMYAGPDFCSQDTPEADRMDADSHRI